MMHNISTAKYERAHGRKPKGWGAWWFGDWDEKWIFRYTGSYTEAKKAAIKAAEGHDEFMVIYPLP